ncbi:putative E3 ubiquitin ligase [Handroanthus impetiginosus]|uniref:E3 ubiquitin-protein ligase RMA n=1 Tax=Handroanthus impetiginosus TaxID=429701 RepID=A0A2G9GF22_9LAMI|nr:putative E3 ubiquitin ligase [Handroanthus impetiginosus]
MAEENPSTMNLDLNLGPMDNSSGGQPGSESYRNAVMNLEGWFNGPAHRASEVARSRHQRWRSLRRQVRIPPETQNLALESIDGNEEQNGEGSVAAEERPPETAKVCENGDGYVEDDLLVKKDDSGKSNGDEGSFFDCNICFDSAKDPVVTCCGHLFCWPCLYQWLRHHSDANECPVCKGEVTVKSVTPIYGRGNNNIREPNVDSSVKIPLRPPAQQVDSWRQAIQRAALSIPMDEMIRRLGSSFDLDRELAEIQSQNSSNHQESPERSNLLLNRILTSRGIRRERTPPVLNDNLLNSMEGGPHRFPSMLRRRPSSLQAVMNSVENLAAERLVESYFHGNAVERTQELPLPFDDRDSISSIAAVIHSESQTVDNAVEIDSRISDMDSGDSPAPRRRRLN